MIWQETAGPVCTCWSVGEGRKTKDQKSKYMVTTRVFQRTCLSSAYYIIYLILVWFFCWFMNWLSWGMYNCSGNWQSSMWVYPAMLQNYLVVKCFRTGILEKSHDIKWKYRRVNKPTHEWYRQTEGQTDDREEIPMCQPAYAVDIIIMLCRSI